MVMDYFPILTLSQLSYSDSIEIATYACHPFEVSPVYTIRINIPALIENHLINIIPIGECLKNIAAGHRS